MAIRLVTFDCARTLLDVDWDPVAFAVRCAREAGLDLPDGAAEAYQATLVRRYGEILAANRTGDYPQVQDVYRSVGREWLRSVSQDENRIDDVIAVSERLLFDPVASIFTPYVDVLSTLRDLRRSGVKTAIVSNWDASLPRVIQVQGISPLIDQAYASLVVGAEKPDPLMLNLAMDFAKIGPDETLHVGDDETDDLGVARNAGTHGILIDRSLPAAPGRIDSLTKVLDWIA